MSAAPAGSRGEEAAVDRVGASSATLAELLMREEAGGALGLMACLKSNEREFGFQHRCGTCMSRDIAMS